jgi:hypothetical protein
MATYVISDIHGQCNSCRGNIIAGQNNINRLCGIKVLILVGYMNKY